MLRRYEITRRSKWLAILNFLLASFIVYTLNSIVVYYVNEKAVAEQLESPYVVRVVANSNSEEDQQLKQEVVSVVQRSMQQLHNEPMELTAANIYTLLEKNYPQIPVQIAIGPQMIPPKIVDNRLYPQQQRNAIVVKLGSGRGDNWFCAVFPNTCEPEFDEKEQKEEQEEQEEPEQEEKSERQWLLLQVWDMLF